MKVKVSISIDENTIKQVEEKLQNGAFRNKSHFVEYAVNELLKEHDRNQD